MARIDVYTRGGPQDMGPEAWWRKVRKATGSPVEVVKADGMKRTLKVDLPPWGILCLQEFRWDLKHRLLSPFRETRGRKIWDRARRLVEHGIPTPQPLLLLELKQLCLVWRTYLATGWLADKVDLGKLALQEAEFDLQGGFEDLLHRAVDLVTKMHNAGFVHGDLKWSNFSYVLGKGPEPFLMDLDSLRTSKSGFWQGKDFARFVFSCFQYGRGAEKADEVIQRYLKGRERGSPLLKWSLMWHLSRKRGGGARQTKEPPGSRA